MQEKPQHRLDRRWLHPLSVLLGFTALYILYFSPVLLGGKLLASGDNFLLYGPLFYMRHAFWNELLMCGYPFVGDPQLQFFYPPAWIFRELLHNWNSYIIVVYVLCSCFAYGLAYALTKSKTAATIGGIIFGMNGWIMSNLVHSGIIHCDIWLPLVIWSFVELRAKFRPAWFAVCSLAVASLVLAGQTAIVAFLMLSVVFWIAGQTILVPKARLKFAAGLLAACALGIGISMVEILPALQYATMGFLRLNIKPFELMRFYNPMQIFLFVFPYLFGGMKESPYGFDYFGPCDFQSVSCYLGLSVLILSLIGTIATWRSRSTQLWFAYCLLMLLLALGDTTPFGKLVYWLPIYNHLRVPPRHLLDFSLGVSVLAAIGTSVMMARGASKRTFALCCTCGVAFVWMLVYPACVVLKLVQEQLNWMAAAPVWKNPALLVPLGISVVQLPILYAFFKSPQSRMSRFALIALVIGDLGSFGWFTQWHYASVTPADFLPPEHAARYRQLLEPLHQRILPVRGNAGTINELPPNLSALWEVPSASGYLNYVTYRFYKFFTMPDGGFVLGDWSSTDNRALDIAAIRYVLCPKNDARFPLPADTTRWKEVQKIGSTLVYENMRAQPRAWLVPEVRKLSAEAILEAARTSKIHGIKSFNPSQTALVEEPCDIGQQAPDSHATVTISNLSSEKIELETQSTKRAFLVLSDTYYPEWTAYIDGNRARILVTDYLFRGLPLPAGRHHVVFRFEPVSLLIGAGICIASLTALLGLYLMMRSRAQTDIPQ